MTAVDTIIFPVKDLGAAKAVFTTLLGAEPHTDEPYYVGYNVDGQEFALDPNGHRKGLTGPVPFWTVDDLEATSAALVAAGARWCSSRPTSAGAAAPPCSPTPTATSSASCRADRRRRRQSVCRPVGTQPTGRHTCACVSRRPGRELVCATERSARSAGCASPCAGSVPAGARGRLAGVALTGWMGALWRQM